MQTTAEPAANTFAETCTNGETLIKEGLTGQWYLWTLLETESGKTIIDRSEAFYFDNQGPSVELTATPVSATQFKLTATATDSYVGEITKYEFYVNEELKETIETTEGTASYSENVASMTAEIPCYAIVTDSLENTTKTTVTAKTKIYTWERYNVVATVTYAQTRGTMLSNRIIIRLSNSGYKCLKSACFSSTTGCYSEGSGSVYSWDSVGGYYYGIGTRDIFNGPVYWTQARNIKK